MVSLHDLRAPAVAVDWHEAVAVVASLAGLLIDARADACPMPAAVALLPSGDLRVTGPGQIPGAPAAAVAGVLTQLLDAAPCPAELRQLADSYAADDRTGPAGHDAMAALLSGLAFYERPGRQAILATLAGRVEAALEQARRVEALEALTERTRAAAGAPHLLADPMPVATPAAPEEPAADAWETPPQSPWRRVAPVAVAIMVFLGMAYLAASWLGDRTSPFPRRAAEIEEELPISGPAASEAIEATRPAAGRPPASPASAATRDVDGPARTPSAANAAGPVARPSAVPVAARSGDAAARAAAGDAAAVLPPKRFRVDVAISEREGRVVPPPAAPVRPAPGGGVFSSSDAQVSPAVLIRPHLPEQPPPDVPEEQIGTLEFVVSETGAVEHVHLISPANRYQERMLVAAAKTWQFRPAMRDGRPVRFRTRIRVTL